MHAGAATEPLESDELLRSLLALRTDSYSGPSWPLDTRLASLLRVPLPELFLAMPAEVSAGGQSCEPDEWATALVITLLQLRHHDRAGVWSALVEVRRHSIPRELMRAAMTFVCETVPTTSTGGAVGN